MTTLYLSDSGLSLPVSLFPWKVEKRVVVEHRAGKLYAQPEYDYLLVKTTKLQYSQEELAAGFEGCKGIVVGAEAPALVLGNLSLLPPVPVVSCLPELTYRLARERSVKSEPLADGVALIPAALPAKDSLSVVVVAPQNVAGQGSGLYLALQDHSPHSVTLIEYEQNWLQYEHDGLVLFKDGQLQEKDAEAALKAVGNADFFHFLQLPPNDDFQWKERARVNNSLVEYLGTDLRICNEVVNEWHDTMGITGLSAWDWTMLTAQGLPWMPYHLPMLCDTGRMGRGEVWNYSGTFRICHPTTNRAFKGTQTFLDAVNSLIKRGVDIEAVVIEGKPHRECLKIKRTCHATFDQFHGIYGVSAIESMAMGHAVIGGVSAWATTFAPDSPMIPATHTTLEAVLLGVVEGEQATVGDSSWVDRSEVARAYAYRNHGLKMGGIRLTGLYDHIRHGHRLIPARREK